MNPSKKKYSMQANLIIIRFNGDYIRDRRKEMFNIIVLGGGSRR